MKLRTRNYMLVATAALAIGVAAACGDGDNGSKADGSAPPYTAVLSTQDIAAGQSRVAYVILKDDAPVRDEASFVRYFRINDDGTSQVVASGRIPWASIGVDASEDHKGGDGHDETELTGVYYTYTEFPGAGKYGIGISLGDTLDEKNEVRIALNVKQEHQAPGIGERAISTPSLTLKDGPLKSMDTSPEPDESMHQMTVGQAIASGKPSVIAFATPSFCQTRTCGPSMIEVVEAQKTFGDRVNFVHVEPYKLTADGELDLDANSNTQLVDAAAAWKLPTEPWVFVVDEAGAVVARFEGPFAFEELMAALAEVTA